MEIFFIWPLKGFHNYGTGNYDFKLCYKYWYRLLVVTYKRICVSLKDKEELDYKLKSEKKSIITYLSILISILIAIYFEVVLSTSRAKLEVLIF